MQDELSRKTVLVVDDDRTNITILTAALKNDYRLLIATNGPMVLHRLESTHPDLILLDIKMPEMDGYEVCEIIKASPATRDIPIIFVSAVNESLEKNRGFALGAVDFITKPFNILELKARVRTHLALEESRRELRKINEELERRVEERTAELRKTAEQLREEIRERLKLAAAMEQTGDSIVITDIQGTIEYVNPAFERITGYRQEELVGRKPSILKSGAQDEAYYRQLWQTILAGRVWQGRLINKKKDGTLYEEDGTISPILDESGATVGFVALKHDVTDRARAEKQARHAQKMEALGILAGGIAHDFNNILSSIIGYADMALDSCRDRDDSIEDIEEVLDAAYRARDLVKQILSFSRRSEQEKRRPLRIAPIAKETVKLLEAALPRNIILISNIDPRTGQVLSDPTHIHQILMNLCTNAAHAMRDKGGVLTVEVAHTVLTPEEAAAHPGLSPGPHSRITVSDTGHGIDRSIMEHIFDPYFTTKRVGEGTGLGLSITHGIVKSAGGEITVASERNKGTSFRVMIPELAQEEYRDETVEIDRTAPMGEGERILIVDSELSLASLWSRRLRELGYQVVPLSSSRDALDTFTDQPGAFDLLITDENMPYLAGSELARLIHEIRPELPIVLSTGLPPEDRKPGPCPHRKVTVLSKPVSPAELARTIRMVLEQSGDAIRSVSA